MIVYKLSMSSGSLNEISFIAQAFIAGSVLGRPEHGTYKIEKWQNEVQRHLSFGEDNVNIEG